MIINDISILGIAETWLKTSLYIQGFIWIGNNWPIAGNRGSGGTGLLIHETFANLITSIETNNHRITATLIEDYLIIVAYAPVVANHQSKKSIDDYINFIIEVQEIIQKNQKNRRQIVLLGDFNAHLKGYLSEIDDLTGEIFSKFIKD